MKRTLAQTPKLMQSFGDPSSDRDTFVKKHMVNWDIPEEINREIKALPNRLYCNRMMMIPLENVFRELIKKGLHTEIKTFDGCFNIRLARKANKLSRHSWGIAIDFNAAFNPLVLIDEVLSAEQYLKIKSKSVSWSEPFLDVWRDNGFICGADWKRRLDGMHFELSNELL